MRTRTGMAALAAALLAIGCGDAAETTRPGGNGATAQAAQVPLTGEVIEVRMISGSGERFDPATIVARRGDVLRLVLEAGVHNVSFPADQNPSGVSLPVASPFLQLPGQAHDITVDMPAGEYFFQCDPHVLLGMVGTLRVQD